MPKRVEKRPYTGCSSEDILSKIVGHCSFPEGCPLGLLTIAETRVHYPLSYWTERIHNSYKKEQATEVQKGSEAYDFKEEVKTASLPMDVNTYKNRYHSNEIITFAHTF